MWAYGTSFSLLLLVATWLTLRLAGESFATLGLTLDSQRVGELGFGFLATSILFAAIALAQATAVGASWQFRGASGFRAAVIGLPVALMLALGEELVFRGYGFRQLVAACGARPAVVVSALAFGLHHLALAGFRPWGERARPWCRRRSATRCALHSGPHTAAGTGADSPGYPASSPISPGRRDGWAPGGAVAHGFDE